ncbi:MAG: hypothetical protein AB1452_09070 [Pseudomonadota bacterium]
MKVNAARANKREQRIEGDLKATVDALFRRWPALHGFSVIDARDPAIDRVTGQLEGELCLADLGLYPCVGDGPSELLGEIAVALLDLIDERPEVRELLRGRTFARALH